MGSDDGKHLIQCLIVPIRECIGHINQHLNSLKQFAIGHFTPEMAPKHCNRAEIRRLICTTNSVEGYHRQRRKVTKSKGAFPTP